MPGRLRDAPVPLSWRYALIAVPIIMASLDVVENGCIAGMLQFPRPGTGLELSHSHEDDRRVLTELLMAMLAILWLVRRSLTVRRLE